MEVRTFVETTRNRIVVLIAGMILRNAHIRLVGEVMRIVRIRIVSEAVPVLERAVRIRVGRRFDDRMIRGASRSETSRETASDSDTSNAESDARQSGPAETDRAVAFRARIGGNRLTCRRDRGGGRRSFRDRSCNGIRRSLDNVGHAGDVGRAARSDGVLRVDVRDGETERGDKEQTGK